MKRLTQAMNRITLNTLLVLLCMATQTLAEKSDSRVPV